MPTVLYSTDFESDAIGALPAGWVNKTGTWSVQAVSPVGGSKAMASNTHADGDAVLYTGIAARADMGLRTDNVVINASASTNRLPFVSHILRSDTAFANGYLIVLQDGAGSSAQLHFEVYKKVSGTISLVVASGDVSLSAPVDGDIYHMRSEIIGTTINVYLWKGASSEPSSPTFTTTNASIAAPGYAGLYDSLLGTSLIPSADNVAIDDATAVGAAFTLAGATAADGFIFQRGAGGTTGAITINGSYTGTPTSIQARLVDAVSGVAVAGFDWATKVASPSGGVFSFSFSSVPQGGYYKVELRDSALPGTVTAPSNKFGVGVRVALIGQSNIETLSIYGTGAGTPSPMLRIYDRWRNPGVWSNAPSSGDGAIVLGNALVAALGGSVPVALIQYAVSGAGLHIGCGIGTVTSGGVARDWLTLTAATGNPWYDFSTAMTLIGPTAEIVVYGQGESDAMVNTNTGTYGADLATLFGRIRTLLGSTMKIVLPLLGQTNYSSTSATAWDVVRQAQIAAAAADGNAFPCSKHDLQCDVNSPDISPASALVWGARLAQKIAYHMGLVAYGDGPSIAAVAPVSSMLYEITLAHSGGTDITPSSSTQVADILVKDGASILTPTNFVRTAADKLRFTLSSPPAGTVTVQSNYGKLPASQAGVVLDNSPLALPLRSSAPVAAAVSTVTGVTVAPSSATVADGGTQQYSATVAGTGSPSQAVSWGASAGSINSSGLFTAPAATGSVQNITITATSAQDGTKAGTAAAIVPAGPVARTVSITLRDAAGVLANLTGLGVAFYAETSPATISEPLYQSGAETTDSGGVLQFTCATLLPSGGTGYVVVQHPDGRHFNGTVAVS